MFSNPNELKLSTPVSSPTALFGLVRALSFLFPLLLLPPAAEAAQFSILLDLDDDELTGCLVATPDGDFAGVERRVTTQVDDSTAEVVDVRMEICNGGSFDPPVSLPDVPPPWPVGLDLGTDGADVVESYLPLPDASQACLRVGFTSDDENGGLDTLLLDDGAPIRLGDCVTATDIPAADSYGLALLALLLAVVAGLMIRRRPSAFVWLLVGLSGSLAVVSGVKAAQDLIFCLDGDPSEWAGNTEVEVVDPAGDTISDVDLTRAFLGYGADDQVLFVRFDDSAPSFPPTAVDDVASVAEDAPATTIDVQANDSDPDGGPSSVLSVTQPTGGTVVITDGGAGVTYEPAPDACNDGAPTDDFTYTLNGGSTANVAVTVTCVNDAPVFIAGADQIVDEDAGSQVVAGWATGLDDGDAEAMQALTFTVSTDNAVLFSIQPAVDAATGDLTYTPAPNASGSATVSVTLMDDGGTASGGVDTSATQMFTLTVSDQADPPTCTTTAGTTAFIEDAGAVILDGGLTVTDPDSANLVSATVTLENLLDPGAETLAASAGGTSISLSYVAPVLALTGTDSLANYQAVLRSVTYENTDDDPDSTPRMISCVVDDGSSTSPASMKTVSITEVNDPPTVATSTIDYAVVGNTLLRVDGADTDDHDTPLPGRVASTLSQVEALGAAEVSDPDSPTVLFVPETAEATDQGGSLTLDDDGDFFYLPPIGFTGVDTEEVVVSDGEGGNVPVTLRFTVSERVWYLEDTVGAKNPPGDADGRSTDAFQTLAALEAAAGPGDILLIFETDTPLDGSLTLKSGQRLYGQRVEEEPISLLPPGLLLEAVSDTDARPQIRRPGGVVITVDATAGTLADVEIRHLDLESGDADVIEITTAGTELVSGLVIDENVITSVGAQGIDLNAGHSVGETTVAIVDNQIRALTQAIDARQSAAGTLVLEIDGNTDLEAGGRGIHVLESAGTVIVRSLDGNSVSGTSAGDGMVFSGVTFDADPSTIAFETVEAGDTAIGDAGDGVGGTGLQITGGSGDLRFGDLDIESSTGLVATGSGVVDVGAGTGLRLRTSAGSSIVATAGPALSLDPLTAGVIFDSIASNGSATHGVALVDIAGSVALGGGSIAGAAGTAFSILRGEAVVTYAGSLDNSMGRSISVTDRTGGSATFSGPLNDTGAGLLVDGNSGGTTTFSSDSKTFDTGANDAITLVNNTGHTVSFPGGGLDVDTTTGTGFTATGGGTVQVGAGVTESSVVSTAGQAVDLDAVATDITFASLASTGSAGHGIDLTNLAGASSFAVTGTTTVTGAAAAGLRLSSAVGAGVDIDFIGTTTVDDAAAEGLRIERMGPGSDVDFGAVDILNRQATGIFLDNLEGTLDVGATSIPNPNSAAGYGLRIEDSAAAIVFASATITETAVGTAATYEATRGLPSNEGDGDAIFLTRNSAATFGLTLNGGMLSNYADNALDLRDSRNIVLSAVTIDGNGAGNSAVQGFDVHSFTLRDSIIREVGDDVNAAPLVGDHGLRFAELEGTLTIQRSQLVDSTGYVLANASVGSANRAVELDNRQGCQVADPTGDCHLTAVITGSTFRGWDFQGLNLRKVGGTLDLDVDGTTADGVNLFQNINGAAVNAGPAQAALAHGHTLDVVGNSFQTVGIGAELFSSRGGPTLVTVEDNLISNTIADGVRIVAFNQMGAGPSGTMTASVRGNTISDVAGATPGAGGGAGVFVATEDGVVAKVLIDDNSIDGLTMGDVAEAFRTQNQRAGELDVVWSNNRLEDFPTNFFGSVFIGNDSSAGTDTCVVFDDNTYTNTDGLFANTYAFDTTAPATISIEGFGGGGAAAVTTFLDGVEASGPLPVQVFGANPGGAACDITPLPRP